MLELRLSDQVTIAVPGRLDSITTYVLLEQESWFEKELGFLSRWLKRGMTAIDIGPNLGVYSLPMARLVGPEGRVFAYEPGSEARSLLARSRAINAAARQGAWNAHLRNRIANSPLCDGARFTRQLEAAYRTMWREWCGRGSAGHV